LKKRRTSNNYFFISFDRWRFIKLSNIFFFNYHFFYILLFNYCLPGPRNTINLDSKLWIIRILTNCDCTHCYYDLCVVSIKRKFSNFIKKSFYETKYECQLSIINCCWDFWIFFTELFYRDLTINNSHPKCIFLWRLLLTFLYIVTLNKSLTSCNNRQSSKFAFSSSKNKCENEAKRLKLSPLRIICIKKWWFGLEIRKPFVK
jgi:hypothetical protein